MQVKHVLFVIYCAVPLLLHMADCEEYCKFEGSTNQQAYCTPSHTNRTFDYVPGITQRIDYLNLNEQPLKRLPRNAFRNITTRNELVHISLEHCQLQHIDVDAFENLDILARLDISYNIFTRLETGTFQHTKKLETFDSHDHHIEKLQTGLFHNLIHLKKLYFNNGNLACIDQDTFRNTPLLDHINLNNNKLEHLSPLYTDRFTRFGLKMQRNLWNCDCNLRELYEIMPKRKQIRKDFGVVCESPRKFRGSLLSFIPSAADLNCDARIIFPKNDTRVVTLGSTVTLSCAVLADPPPEIEWHSSFALLARYTGFSSTYFHMHYLNYTFTVQEEDLGVYHCYTRNPRDIVGASTTLTVNATTQ